jgi:hypothetical protein
MYLSSEITDPPLPTVTSSVQVNPFGLVVQPFPASGEADPVGRPTIALPLDPSSPAAARTAAATTPPANSRPRIAAIVLRKADRS